MALEGKILVLTYFTTLLHGICMAALAYALKILSQKLMKKRLKNQRYILANLCVIEFLIALCFVKLQIQEILDVSKNTADIFIGFSIQVALAVHYPLSMHHIAIDRFLEIYLHLKYPSAVTKRRTKKVIIATWIFSVLFSAVIIFLHEFVFSSEAVHAFMSYYVFVMDLSVLATAVFTYGYLYQAYNRLRSIDRRNSLSRKLNSGNFRIPMLIILTYCLFEVSGAFLTLAAYAVELKATDLVRKIALLLYAFGFLADASIYIFCHRKRTELTSQNLL